VSAAGLGAVTWAAWQRARCRGPALVFPWLTLTLAVFLLASKKASAGYLVMAFFPVCATAALGAGTRAPWLLGALSVAATVEPSLWARWARNADLPAVVAELGGGPVSWRAASFLAVELVLVAGYAWLAWVAWRVLRGSRSAPAW
jgi:hypothetical protein